MSDWTKYQWPAMICIPDFRFALAYALSRRDRRNVSRAAGMTQTALPRAIRPDRRRISAWHASLNHNVTGPDLNG
jgi:hypothetical protein